MDNSLFGVPSSVWLFEIWPFLSVRDVVALVTSSRAVFITAAPILSRQITTLQQEIASLQSQMPMQALADVDTQLAPLLYLISTYKFSKTDWLYVRVFPKPPAIVITALQVIFGIVLGIANLDKSEIWREMSRISLLEEYGNHLLSKELSQSCVRKLLLVAKSVDREALEKSSRICGLTFDAALAKLEMETINWKARPLRELLQQLGSKITQKQQLVTGFDGTLSCLKHLI